MSHVPICPINRLSTVSSYSVHVYQSNWKIALEPLTLPSSGVSHCRPHNTDCSRHRVPHGFTPEDNSGKISYTHMYPLCTVNKLTLQHRELVAVLLMPKQRRSPCAALRLACWGHLPRVRVPASRCWLVPLVGCMDHHGCCAGTAVCCLLSQ